MTTMPVGEGYIVGQDGRLVYAGDDTWITLLPPTGSIWNNGTAPPDDSLVDFGGPLYPYWNGNLDGAGPNDGGLSNPNAPVRSSITGTNPSTILLLIGFGVLVWVMFKR